MVGGTLRSGFRRPIGDNKALIFQACRSPAVAHQKTSQDCGLAWKPASISCSQLCSQAEGRYRLKLILEENGSKSPIIAKSKSRKV